jgi:hypothetical protein
VKLYSRPGNELTDRFPLIVEALARLRARSSSSTAILPPSTTAASPASSGCPTGGMATAFSFGPSTGAERGRSPPRTACRAQGDAGQLASRVRQQVCASMSTSTTTTAPWSSSMPASSGLEGIVSKRKNSRYRLGRSPDWIKSKNPNAPAVKREAEENWGRRSEPSPQPVEADTSPQKADSLDHIGDRGQNGCTHRSDTWLHPNDFAQTSDSFSLRGGRRPCTTPTGL